MITAVALLLLACLMGAEAQCTTTRPIRLRANEFRPCNITRLNEKTLRIQSENYPEDYPNSTFCDGRLRTDEPRYLEVRPARIQLANNDRLFIRSIFGYEREVTAADEGASVIVPTTHSRVRFTSNFRRSDRGFRTRATARGTSCHRVCTLSEGHGSVDFPASFAANTICEFWLTAPPSCNIVFTFTTFSVGTAGSPCPNGFVGFDLTGDPTYSSSSAINFCGSSLPPQQTSVANRANVILYGGPAAGSVVLNYYVQCPTTPVITTPTTPTTPGTTATGTTATGTTATGTTATGTTATGTTATGTTATGTTATGTTATGTTATGTTATGTTGTGTTATGTTATGTTATGTTATGTTATGTTATGTTATGTTATGTTATGTTATGTTATGTTATDTTATATTATGSTATATATTTMTG